MVKKTTQKEVEPKLPEGVEVVEWFEAVTFNPSNKKELLWLHDTLKSLGITQIGQLEVKIANA